MAYYNIFSNDDDIALRVNKAARLTGDSRPFIKEFLEIIALSTDERFDQEVDPKGKPWKKLSRRRLAEKRQKKLINKTLQARGFGRASINTGMRGRVGYIGTNLEYMARHHRGQGVPKREIFGVTSQDVKDFNEVMAKRLSGQPRR